MKWYIVVCRVTEEQKICNLFTRYSIETYLPKYRDPLGRLLPLFPAYFFPHQLVPTHELGMTRINYLHTCGLPSTITEEVIEDIRLIETKLREEPPPARKFEVGDEVLLINGFFLGKRGRIIRITRNQGARIMMPNGYELSAQKRDFAII